MSDGFTFFSSRINRECFTQGLSLLLLRLESCGLPAVGSFCLKVRGINARSRRTSHGLSQKCDLLQRQVTLTASRCSIVHFLSYIPFRLSHWLNFLPSPPLHATSQYNNPKKWSVIWQAPYSIYSFFPLVSRSTSIARSLLGKFGYAHIFLHSLILSHPVNHASKVTDLHLAIIPTGRFSRSRERDGPCLNARNAENSDSQRRFTPSALAIQSLILQTEGRS